MSALTSKDKASGGQILPARRKLMIPALVAAFTCIASSPLAFSQATRTWVSGVGDDANPGSRTAPCKTFAGAISKTAAGGEISALDPGGYGAVTITQSMTLEGEGTLASILGAGTNCIVINAGAGDVVNLRNLNLNGSATGLNGIKIISAAEVNIERCIIAKCSQLGIEIACATPCRVNVRDSIVRDCPGGAVFAKTNSVLTMVNCSLLEGQFGLRMDGGATAHLEKCIISGNTGNGVMLNTSLVPGVAIANLNDCVLTDNAVAGVTSKGATSTVRLSNNTISGNGIGLNNLTGGSSLSYGNNQISGNTTDGSPTGSILLK